MNSSSNVYLVTFYSDRKYKRAALRLRKQALKSELFAKVEVWTPKRIEENIPNQYVQLQKLRELLQDEDRGYGLWYWKPVVIEETLKKLPSRSIVIYLDAGCYLNLGNQNAIWRMQEYIQLAETHGSLAMQLNDGDFGICDLTEGTWTSDYVLDVLNVPEHDRLSNQIQAGIQFMKVNEINTNFVTKWRELCEVEDFGLLRGINEIAANRTHAHRYDQSLFSCLYKKELRFFMPDETFFSPDWQVTGRNYPIWALRNRDGIDPFKFRISDLIPRVSRKINLFLARTR